MSYPDFTATTLAGLVTVPSGIGPVTARRVATSFSGVMTVTVQAASDSTDVAYPMVQNVVFTGPGPSYHITGTVRGVTVGGVYQVKAANASDPTFPQYFNVDSSGNWDFFHADNDPAHWAFTPIRIADSLLFSPAWPDETTQAQWSLSVRYGIKEQIAPLLTDYPFTSPAPDYFPATYVAAHVDPSRVMSGTVTATATGGTARDLRAYTLWDLVSDVAIGAVTYCNVPDRRSVALGSQLDGLRADLLTLTNPPTWNDSICVEADGSFSFSNVADTMGELDLVRATDLEIVARASMTNQFPREFFFYPTDTTVINGTLAYGSAFEEVVFPPYAASVVGLSYLTRALQSSRYTATQVDAAYVNARLIAYGLSQTVQAGGGIGGLPFAFSQREQVSASTVEYYRTGSIAWGAWFMFLAHDVIPAGYWTGDYSAWRTTILTEATSVLNWVYAQRDGSNLVRFGTGRYDPGTGIFDSSYQYDIHSTEHQIDAAFLYLRAATSLSDAVWTTRANTLKAAVVTNLWDDANSRLYQGCDGSLTPDGVSALDCYTWGAIFMQAFGETAYALRMLTRASSLYSVVSVADNGKSVQGYQPYVAADGVAGITTGVWIEGTAGMLGAKQRLNVFTAEDQALYRNLANLQQSDGSFRNFQVADTAAGIGDFRSSQAAAWYAIARNPSLAWWTETP